MSEKQIKLSTFNEILDSMELVGPGIEVYFDTQTGEVTPVTEMEVEMAEDDSEDAADWQQEISVKVRQILENLDGRYLKLPDSFDIHEWDQMRRFALAQEDDKISVELERAIHNDGAFHRFKNLIRELGLTADWFQFRKNLLRKLTLEWCEENKIKVTELND